MPQPQNLPQANSPLQSNNKGLDEKVFAMIFDLIGATQAWAAPTLQDKIAFIDAFRKSMITYHQELVKFSDKQKLALKESRVEYYKNFQEYSVLSQYAPTLFELPQDTAIVSEQYLHTMAVEVKDLLEKFHSEKNSQNPSYDVIQSLENTAKDVESAQNALQDIQIIYSKSYPTNFEESPDAWFAPGAYLLLE
jgi:hypothetical protein